MGKVGLIFMIGLTIFSVWGLYILTHQDCDSNPPQTFYCSSTNIFDDGYEDCKLVQHKENNLIFPDKKNIYDCEYNGNRIRVEEEKTKCSYSDSNLTSDYMFCK